MYVKLFEEFIAPMSVADIKDAVMKEMERVTGGDPTKLIGRCSEASLMTFKLLVGLGQDAAAIDGEYHGAISDSSKEYFRGNRHSWVVCNGYIVDPTRWVFDWENIEPFVEVIPSPDKDYVGKYKPITAWQDWWNDELKYSGFKL